MPSFATNDQTDFCLDPDSQLHTLLMEAIDGGESSPMTPQDWEDIRSEGLLQIASRSLPKSA